MTTRNGFPRGLPPSGFVFVAGLATKCLPMRCLVCPEICEEVRLRASHALQVEATQMPEKPRKKKCFESIGSPCKRPTLRMFADALCDPVNAGSMAHGCTIVAWVSILLSLPKRGRLHTYPFCWVML
mmetsp:Transcript_42714/g.84581  ORF Transcript_42714/g.84581 Transcript_42714/m.84581 type:complete len:127 (+) Transcript_42714:1684-2064(+)